MNTHVIYSLWIELHSGCVGGLERNGKTGQYMKRSRYLIVTFTFCTYINVTLFTKTPYSIVLSK